MNLLAMKPIFDSTGVYKFVIGRVNFTIFISNEFQRYRSHWYWRLFSWLFASCVDSSCILIHITILYLNRLYYILYCWLCILDLFHSNDFIHILSIPPIIPISYSYHTLGILLVYLILCAFLRCTNRHNGLIDCEESSKTGRRFTLHHSKYRS